MTKFTSPNGISGLPSSGDLVDASTGLATGVSMSVSGGSNNGAGHADDGRDAVAGSDAHAVFDGFVSTRGTPTYQTSSDFVVTLSGLEPARVYDVVFNADRADYTWERRASLVSLTGAVGFVNASSDATDDHGDPLFGGPGVLQRCLPSDNPTGLVARWNDVEPGLDGVVELVVSYDGDPLANGGEDVDKGKYASALALFNGGVNPSPALTFQDGVSGYDWTVDTYLNVDLPGTSYATARRWSWTGRPMIGRSCCGSMAYSVAGLGRFLRVRRSSRRRSDSM